MSRSTKQIISGIALIISIAGILISIRIAYYSSLVVILLCIVAMMSIVAFIVFSKTGAKVEGSKAESDAVIMMRPPDLVFWNRKYDGQVEKNKEKEKIEDQRRDDEYDVKWR